MIKQRGYANMTDVNRQITGRRSKQLGETFERWLITSCEYYYNKGVAVIEKTPEPMRPLRPYGDRKRGQFIACYTKHAQPDFKGCLKEGVCIIFDAKYTDSDRLQQSAVTEAQAECFDKYEKMGAECFIIAALGFQNFYRIPWKIWKNMKQKFGHKYMAKDKELKDYKVPYTNMAILFLEGVEY